MFSLDISFFPGFYGTLYDCGENEYETIKNELDFYNDNNDGRTYTEDDFVFDWDAYRNSIAKLYTEGYSNYALEIPFIKSIVFDEIDSPTYYNFRNDRIYAWFEFADTWKQDMEKFMRDKHDWLCDIIKEEHTSRSGFISFMSNNIDDWFEKIFVEEDTLYIEDMIKYMLMDMFDAHTLAEDIEMYVFKHTNESDFVSLKETVNA